MLSYLKERQISVVAKRSTKDSAQSGPAAHQMAARLLSTAPDAAGLLHQSATGSRGRDQLGGIDMNDDKLELVIRKDGKGVALPVQDQDPALEAIPGFIPLIIDIRPAAGSELFSLLHS